MKYLTLLSLTLLIAVIISTSSIIKPRKILYETNPHRNDSSSCGTAERDSLEFKNLPYYNNNQYLENLLDSIDYPLAETHLKNGGMSPMNYANYPTKYWIPVKLWVLRLGNNSSGATVQQIKGLIDRLNSDFRINSTMIQFYLKCDISYLNDDNYSDLNDAQSINLAKQYHELGAVNMFLGFRLNDDANGVYYGSGVLSNFYKAIFIAGKVYTDPETYSTVSHEMGHYFGLDHTHQYFDKPICLRELVSRTRSSQCLLTSGPMCQTTGGALSDTPADPNINNNNDCQYLQGGNDLFGDPHTSNPPQTDNLTSYNGKRECRTHFTRLQVAVMLNSIERPLLVDTHKTGWAQQAGLFDTYEPDNTKEMASEISRCEVQNRNFHMQYNSSASPTSLMTGFDLLPRRTKLFISIRLQSREVQI